jgi:hypothetical protein
VMSNIIDVRNAVIRFLKENINTEDVTVIKVEKSGDNWKTVSEVYEDDSFLKSMNLPPKKIRLFYSVVLDNNIEVIAFNRVNNYNDPDNEND